MLIRVVITEFPLVGILQEGLAADKLHGEVGLRAEAGIGSAGFIDLRNAHVLQPAKRLGLLFEPTEQLGAGESRLDDFQGDGSARQFLFGLVHSAHAAFADHPDDPVAADHYADFELCIQPLRTGSHSVRARERRQRGHEGLVWIFHVVLS